MFALKHRVSQRPWACAVGGLLWGAARAGEAAWMAGRPAAIAGLPPIERASHGWDRIAQDHAAALGRPEVRLPDRRRWMIGTVRRITMSRRCAGAGCG